MTVAYEPGEEIQLSVNSKYKFFSKALDWPEQKTLWKRVDAIKVIDLGDTKNTEMEQTDLALELLIEYLTRIEPEIELSEAGLAKAKVLDYRKIWELVNAIQYTFTAEDKKKLD